MFVAQSELHARAGRLVEMIGPKGLNDVHCELVVEGPKAASVKAIALRS